MTKAFLKTLVISQLVLAAAFAGSIDGVIKYEGKVPKMKTLDTGSDPICHKSHKDKPLKSEALVLGKGNTMANIIVKITKGLAAKKYPVPKDALVISQAGCMYSPHVFAVQKGQTVKILNPDATMHNVHTMPKKNRPFNKSMPKHMKETTTKFKKVEGPFKIKCDVHPWMGAWAEVVGHPYFAVTGTDGKYSLEDVPDGDYTVTAWHEKLGEQTGTAKVAGGAATLDFTFKK